MSLRSQLAFVAAAAVVVIGLLGLINPVLLLRLVGLEIFEPRGLGEARAFFGAFLVAMGGYLLWGLLSRPRARPLLRFAAFLWLASASGRLLSLFFDAPFSMGSTLILVLELFLGIGLLAGATESEGARDAAAARRRTPGAGAEGVRGSGRRRGRGSGAVTADSGEATGSGRGEGSMEPGAGRVGDDSRSRQGPDEK